MAHFLPPEHVRQVIKLEWPFKDVSVKDGWNLGVTYYKAFNISNSLILANLGSGDCVVILKSSKLGPIHNCFHYTI